MVTRTIVGLSGLTYEQRLNKLNLFSLQRRRLLGDLIEYFKILKGFSDISQSALCIAPSRQGGGGHALKLGKPHCKGSRRAHSFALRAINAFNILSSHVVETSSVPVFKRWLNEVWDNVFEEQG